MKKKAFMMVIFLLYAVFLWGCSGVDPEKRAYPQVIAVDRIAGGDMVIFGMPNMQETTGQEKSGEENQDSTLVFTGKSMEEIYKHYNETQEKYLDLGHVNVLILGKGMIEAGYWEQLLVTMKEETSFGEDIYVFTTEDIEKVMGYNGTRTNALGDYLIGVYENRPYDMKKAGTTLRQVYKTWYETNHLPVLPQLTIQENGYLKISE